MRDFDLDFDPKACLLTDEHMDDIFGDDRDKEEEDGDTIEYWYYRGAVVFWPVSKNIQVAKEAGQSFLLSCLNSAEESKCKECCVHA